MNPFQLGGDSALAYIPPRIQSIGQAIKDAVTRYQQNDQVKKQARLHKEGHKEGQQRPQKRQKQQCGTDWVGLNFVKLVTRFHENDQVKEQALLYEKNHLMLQVKEQARLHKEGMQRRFGRRNGPLKERDSSSSFNYTVYSYGTKRYKTFTIQKSFVRYKTFS